MSSPDITVNLAYLIGGAALASISFEQLMKRKPMACLIATAIIANIILDNMVTIMAQFSYSPTDPNGIATMFFYWFFDAVTTVCAAVAYYLRCKAMTSDKRVQRLLAANLIPVAIYILVDITGIYSTVSQYVNGKGYVFTIGYSLNALLVCSNALYHIYFIYMIKQMMGHKKTRIGIWVFILPIFSGVFLIATSLEIVVQALNDNIISSGRLWMAWNLDLMFFTYVNKAISESISNPVANTISSTGAPAGGFGSRDTPTIRNDAMTSSITAQSGKDARKLKNDALTSGRSNETR